MACNCKGKEIVKKIEKYSDFQPETKRSGTKWLKYAEAIVERVLTILFGLLMGVLFIVITIPTLVYVGGCVIFGIEPHINIDKLKSLCKK